MVSLHIMKSLLQDETHSLVQKRLCVLHLRLCTANPLRLQLQQCDWESPKDKKRILKDAWIIDFLEIWKSRNSDCWPSFNISRTLKLLPVTVAPVKCQILSAVTTTPISEWPQETRTASHTFRVIFLSTHLKMKIGEMHFSPIGQSI